MVSLQNRKFEKDAERVKSETRNGSLKFPSIFQNLCKSIYSSLHFIPRGQHSFVQNHQKISLTFLTFSLKFQSLKVSNLSLHPNFFIQFRLLRCREEEYTTILHHPQAFKLHLSISLFKKRQNQVPMVEPNALMIINMHWHFRFLQVQVIIFHQRTRKIHEEIREKEEMQDSLSFFSNFEQNLSQSSKIQPSKEDIRVQKIKWRDIGPEVQTSGQDSLFPAKKCHIPAKGAGTRSVRAANLMHAPRSTQSFSSRRELQPVRRVRISSGHVCRSEGPGVF